MPTIRVLFRSPGVEIGTFRCPPGDRAWRQENSIGEGYHVAFPGTPVLIAQARARPVVTNANHAVFYNDREPYRRGLLSERGDDCVFIRTDGAFLRELLADIEPRLADDERHIFPFVDGPVAPSTHLLQQLLVRHLQGTPEPDRLLVDETLVRILAEAVRAAVQTHGDGRSRRSGTAEEHADLVEQARQLLTRRFAERLDLHEIAAAVHSSPYHLARVFRARTGYALHEYRNQLRLRASLQHLAGPARQLAGVAVEVGFTSHSHYSDAFRKSFSMSPSAYRRAAAAPSLVGPAVSGRPGRPSRSGASGGGSSSSASGASRRASSSAGRGIGGR